MPRSFPSRLHRGIKFARRAGKPPAARKYRSEMKMIRSQPLDSARRKGPSVALATLAIACALSLACKGGAQGALNDSGGNSSTITCSSSNGQRIHCNANTLGGVRLVRQLSSSPCKQGSTWGYDSRGIWVDRDCSAEFDVVS